jgi:hypothetical protein
MSSESLLIYAFLDVGQLNRPVRQGHWDNLQYLRSQLVERPRPINNTKNYGGDQDRGPAWIAWRYDMTGLLYWGGMSDWQGVEDPWTDPKTLDRRNRRADGRGPLFNGEGTLVYPGRAVGYDGIASSLRPVGSIGSATRRPTRQPAAAWQG